MSSRRNGNTRRGHANPANTRANNTAQKTHTWYSTPSGPSAATPIVPFLPTKSAGTVMSDLQKVPRFDCAMVGERVVQLPASGVPTVARNSQVVEG